jgi:hypothetical protein
MYDPQLPHYDYTSKAFTESEKGFAGKDVELGRSDSVVSEQGRMSYGSEKGTMKPMKMQSPEKALHVRPARPWTVVSGRDDEAHAM